jgi:NNP family nitrate/nitrite transporter-like MFS transporter
MAEYLLTRWEPENPEFWEREGRSIARRNLWISIPCLMLAFVVSVLWSVVTLKLPAVGFSYSKDQLFLLTALPALSGATLRIFYSFMPSFIGGRRWTALSTASLLIPCLWLGSAVQDPTTPYPTMLIIALLCGLGSGNFASSMANIAYFFPRARKGSANGLNAGFGNLGVSVAQFVIPLVIGASVFGDIGGPAQHTIHDKIENILWLQNAGLFWVPLIAIASIAAWFGMNDIADARASFAEQAVIFKRKHNWLMCWLYLGTFGSFIGFSAGFALLTKTQFPNIVVVHYAFIGPLLGALARPIGGMVSDRIGGARVTVAVFVIMALAVLGALHFLPGAGSDGSFPGFLAMFLLLFTCTGIGNGSTYRMIPVIFSTQCMNEARGQGEAAKRQARLDGMRESAAAAGFISAIGAYGGFFIPQAFGTSMRLTGGPQFALYCFIAFYLSCVVLCAAFYARKGAAMPC